MVWSRHVFIKVCLVISNRPNASRSSNFGITPWIVLHTVQLLFHFFGKLQWLQLIGNRTSCCPIQFVIILMINNSDSSLQLSDFDNHLSYYRPKWTLLSSITVINKKRKKKKKNDDDDDDDVANPGSTILTIPEAVSTSSAVCTVTRGLLDCAWRTIAWPTSLCCLVTKWSLSSSMLSNDCSRRDTWLMSNTLLAAAAAAVGVGAWFLDNSMASRCVFNKLFD